jgi:hypothetical protein
MIPKYLSYLIITLFDKQSKTAEALLSKHNLYHNNVFIKEGYHSRVKAAYNNRNSIDIYPSILIEKDSFGATEHVFLGRAD